MQFRIADTFTSSLARLTGDEQKSVKIAALDLQLNPAHPSLQFHKLEKAKDKRFWSVRAGSDVRVIVHRADDSLLLCYTAHHDAAYHWAEKRRLEVHPQTGAAQLVELRETIQEVFVPNYVEDRRPKPLLFAHIPDSELLGYGVPAAWLEAVKAADEDTVLTVATHLPAEAAEAVLELAIGGKPKQPAKLTEGADPFEHPDAKRRFRVMKNVEELERALAYPWEKWAVFLHPEQTKLVEREFNGPARVAGSAGTGKTIVALHRAACLARKHSEARILLTTFSEALAEALDAKLRLLLSSEPRLMDRIEVAALDAVALRLYRRTGGKAQLTTVTHIPAPGTTFSPVFLLSEWEHVVDAWQLETWEAYRDVTRLGRRTRLNESQRAALWQIFSELRADMAKNNQITQAGIFAALTSGPFDYIVVDEAQDIGVAQLRFLAKLAAGRTSALFFTGDLGQRIFQQPFSWKALGVDVRGRSSTLKINYRTSHQIRRQADLLLGPEVTDVDGNKEERNGTISLFNGSSPTVKVLANVEAERVAVSAWVADRLRSGTAPTEIGILVRSEAELPRAFQASGTTGCAVTTMHLAKGLEFRAVAVMACDDEVIPLQKRIETAADKGELEEVYATERHLLYVACTRARDHLLVTGVKPTSEFLEDLSVAER